MWLSANPKVYRFLLPYLPYTNRYMQLPIWMKKLLNQLSPVQELLIVITVVFGWSIFVSNYQFFRNFISSESTDVINYHCTSLSYFRILLFELAIISLLAPFLEARKWRHQDFPFKISFSIIGAGFLLLFLNNFLINISSYLPFF